MTRLYQGTREVTRSDFNQIVRRRAAVLQSIGLGEDGIIALLMRNDIVCLEVVEACRLLGARYVMINWHAAEPEILHILADSGAKALIGHVDLLAVFSGDTSLDLPILSVETPEDVSQNYNVEVRVQTTPLSWINFDKAAAEADPFIGEPLRFRGLFAYTSGSTGRPKGIRRNTDPSAPDPYAVYARLASDMLLAKPGDTLMVAAPLYHSAPNALSIFALASGYTNLVIESQFEPEAFLAAIERHKVSHIYVVPTMMVRLLKLPSQVRSRYDLSSLRYAVSTGSPWPIEVKRAMIDWLGPIFYESYGASELGFMTLISSQEALEKPGSVGRILPGGSIKIFDDDLRPCAPGDIGTIYVNLPMFGDFAYTNTEGSIVDQRVEGHATVGDVGHLDEDGYLFIGDRKKDMIISGGANIFPAEIEAQLIKMPQVADCAVFGAPDAEFGEMIVAAVQCIPGQSVTLGDVQSFLKPLLAKFKVPRKLDIHEELPREDSGKIFKKRLRDPYWVKAGRTI